MSTQCTPPPLKVAARIRITARKVWLSSPTPTGTRSRPPRVHSVAIQHARPRVTRFLPIKHVDRNLRRGGHASPRQPAAATTAPIDPPCPTPPNAKTSPSRRVSNRLQDRPFSNKETNGPQPARPIDSIELVRFAG